MYAAFAPALLLIVHLSHCNCADELICPELGYIGSEAKLTCIGASSRHIYTTYPNIPVSTCNVTSQQCINTGNEKGAVINATHTVLTIPSVRQSDAGEWGCTASTPLTCSMAVAKVPSCNITSASSRDEFCVKQNVSLSIDAKGFYCSMEMKLELRSGSNVTDLKQGNLTAITNETFTRQLELTESYSRNVRLDFTCNSKKESIPCSGIKELEQRSNCTSATSGFQNSEILKPMTWMFGTIVVCAIDSALGRLFL